MRERCKQPIKQAAIARARGSSSSSRDAFAAWGQRRGLDYDERAGVASRRVILKAAPGAGAYPLRSATADRTASPRTWEGTVRWPELCWSGLVMPITRLPVRLDIDEGVVVPWRSGCVRRSMGWVLGIRCRVGALRLP